MATALSFAHFLGRVAFAGSLHAVGFHKEIEGRLGVGFGLGLPNIMQIPLGFGLQRLWRRPLVA
ncbi:hypothetical protein BV911_19040 [Pseudoruegeria sp. SK021]|nr:hypothetical protein BV911_19040 [Pseudoruegeria sp. SK021]